MRLNQSLKNSQQTKVHDQMASQVNSTKRLETVNIHASETVSKKTVEEEHFQTHSMRPALL